MSKICYVVDFISRGLDPCKNWTSLDQSSYVAYVSRKKQKPIVDSEEVRNNPYTIPGRDYLKEERNFV
jgi:hypothetical protein